VMNGCPIKNIQAPWPVLFAVGTEQLEFTNLLADHFPFRQAKLLALLLRKQLQPVR